MRTLAARIKHRRETIAKSIEILLKRNIAINFKDGIGMTDETSKKDKAIELLNSMDIYEPYVEEFMQNDQICAFQDFSGYYIEEDSYLGQKIKMIEEKYNCLAYAVTHEYTKRGSMYSIAIVTDYPEEWDGLIESEGDRHNVYAYVWNVGDERSSELGYIALRSYGGGIKRIA